MPPVVTLISHTPNPIQSLYMAYRVCYSSLTPEAALARIARDQITPEEMEAFVVERLKTGHTSPLEQVVFEFGISGVSRAFSHQFVRTRVGQSVEQQSQRYVTYKDGAFPYVVPPSLGKGTWAAVRFVNLMAEISRVYADLIKEGVPAEDARFVLPNATATNFKLTINFAALLHVADMRLCLQAQWEYIRVVAMMRREVIKVAPILGRMLGAKCQPYRHGVCDESFATWEQCPLGGLNGVVRPHKSQVELLTLDASPEFATRRQQEVTE